MKKQLYRRIRAVLLTMPLVGLATFAIYGGYRAWTSAASEVQPITTAIRPTNFTIRIPAKGELRAVESTSIVVPAVPVQSPLRIASIVPDGTRVKKGDVLVEFDPTELDLQAVENRSLLETANQKINKGEMAASAEKSDVVKERKLAELELEKLKEFQPKDDSIFTRREIIEGQLDKGYTEQKIIFADVRLQLKGKVYSLDEAILLLERRQATNKIGQVEKAMASLKLLSPVSGVVVYPDPGGFFGGDMLMPGRNVYLGMSLFSIVKPEQMEARCFVLEKDVGEARTDQMVRVTLDPFPGNEYIGKVKNIDKLARPIERDSPVKYFQVILSLDTTDQAVMKPGVKLKAEIQATELTGVIVVPRSAVIKKDAAFFAYVQNGPNQFEPLPVSLGPGDLVQVVVTKGLSPGQMLALNPPDVKSGSRSLKPAKEK